MTAMHGPASTIDNRNIVVLMPSASLFVVEVFRLFDEFRRGYDPSYLDAAQGIIRQRLGTPFSHGVMSDALLLDNELRVRTTGHLVFMPAGSATASRDERSLARLLAALQVRSYRHAAECAVDLDILQSRTVLLLAERLTFRLREAGLVLPFTATSAGPDKSANGSAAAMLRVV
jgi:hypothetical protein